MGRKKCQLNLINTDTAESMETGHVNMVSVLSKV